MSTQFLVHNANDNVGVVVVEDIAAGQKLNGWRMDLNDTLDIEALEPIPLGHKIALTDLSEGDTITKYGHDIGRVIKPVTKGHHVHVHNVKTKRW